MYLFFAVFHPSSIFHTKRWCDEHSLFFGFCNFLYSCFWEETWIIKKHIVSFPVSIYISLFPFSTFHPTRHNTISHHHRHPNVHIISIHMCFLRFHLFCVRLPLLLLKSYYANVMWLTMPFQGYFLFLWYILMSITDWLLWFLWLWLVLELLFLLKVLLIMFPLFSWITVVHCWLGLVWFRCVFVMMIWLAKIAILATISMSAFPAFPFPFRFFQKTPPHHITYRYFTPIPEFQHSLNSTNQIFFSTCISSSVPVSSPRIISKEITSTFPPALPTKASKQKVFSSLCSIPASVPL